MTHSYPTRRTSVLEIAQGGAAALDRFGQHFTNPVGEPRAVGARQLARAPRRPDAGAEQAFRRIDLAGTDDDVAVHDEVLDGHHAAARDRKSTRLNSSHYCAPRMPSSACKQN